MYLWFNSLAALSTNYTVIGTTWYNHCSATVASNKWHTFNMTLPSSGVWVVSVSCRVQSSSTTSVMHAKLSGLHTWSYFSGYLTNQGDIYPMVNLSNIVKGNRFSIMLLHSAGTTVTVDCFCTAVRIA